ncbi:hypothetical protein ABZ379_28005 [Streptomyces canus]|uniref:hypothetical protein n=1 Tax=Streptomyces canus TaxID=58343 RepID=UPI0033EC5168
MGPRLDAAIAFDHRDLDLQERALDVVARHLKAAGDSVLPQLRTAAARISPGLAPRAADLFGTAPDHLTDQATSQVAGQPTAYADLLPAVPEPRPVPGPIETAVEVAEELAAVVADDKDVVRFERVLDGLVRHAHHDREALAQTLQPVMRKEPRHRTDCTQSGVYDVAAALRGDKRDNFLTPPLQRGQRLPGRMAAEGAAGRGDRRHRGRRAAVPAGRADRCHRSAGRRRPRRADLGA